jgi:hypothetical protein
LRSSFAEIVRINKSKKRRRDFAERNADLNQGNSCSENESDTAVSALSSGLPSQKNDAVQIPTKAAAEVDPDALSMSRQVSQRLNKHARD